MFPIAPVSGAGSENNGGVQVCWVPFNEGWGQYDTRGVTDWLRSVDPSRLINSASGGCDSGGAAGVGNMYDIHQYPWPTGLTDPPLDTAHLETSRVTVVGEWGGLGFAAPAEHSWDAAAAEQGWGYATYKTEEETTAELVKRTAEILAPMAAKRVVAAIWTQVRRIILFLSSTPSQNT